MDRKLLDEVHEKIAAMVEDGKINLPKTYSPGNALMSAWILLSQKTVKVDGKYKLLLDTCSRASVSSALLNMVIMGLSTGKDQCHFIRYGKTLTCRPSYFGDTAIVKRLTSATDVLAQVVYAADDFEYEIVEGTKKVTLHRQSLSNISGENIVAAYCTVLRPTGSLTEIMTIEQIHTAWDQADSSWKGPKSVHSKFPEEMAKRTVIRRLCKNIINETSDEFMAAAWLESTYEKSSPVEKNEVIDFKEDNDADVRDGRRGNADMEDAIDRQESTSHIGDSGYDVPGQSEADTEVQHDNKA